LVFISDLFFLFSSGFFREDVADAITQNQQEQQQRNTSSSSPSSTSSSSTVVAFSPSTPVLDLTHLSNKPSFVGDEEEEEEEEEDEENTSVDEVNQSSKRCSQLVAQPPTNKKYIQDPLWGIWAAVEEVRSGIVDQVHFTVVGLKDPGLDVQFVFTSRAVEVIVQCSLTVTEKDIALLNEGGIKYNGNSLFRLNKPTWGWVHDLEFEIEPLTGQKFILEKSILLVVNKKCLTARRLVL
jgi:hypothetical protein